MPVQFYDTNHDVTIQVWSKRTIPSFRLHVHGFVFPHRCSCYEIMAHRSGFCLKEFRTIISTWPLYDDQKQFQILRSECGCRGLQLKNQNDKLDFSALIDKSLLIYTCNVDDLSKYSNISYVLACHVKWVTGLHCTISIYFHISQCRLKWRTTNIFNS